MIWVFALIIQAMIWLEFHLGESVKDFLESSQNNRNISKNLKNQGCPF